MSYSVYVLCVITCLMHELCGHYIDNADISFTSIYYDPKSRIPFRISAIENNLMNTTGKYDQSSTKTTGVGMLRKISYRSNGCTCQELTCGCCAGINLNQFQFNREACMNFTYDPNDFAINMNMLMNGDSFYSNSVSAKNPPPLCIPVPIPYVPLSVEGCARIFNIFTPGRNLHMCFDFETRIQSAAVLVLHFDCMRMGSDGVALVKPGDNGGLPSSTTENQIDSDIYDVVTEIKYIKHVDGDKSN